MTVIACRAAAVSRPSKARQAPAHQSQRWGFLTRAALDGFAADHAYAPNGKPGSLIQFWALLLLELIVLAAFVAPAALILGSVTISLADLLAGITVFIVLLGVTRFIQQTVEKRLFPHTRIDPGVQHSFRTLIGYAVGRYNAGQRRAEGLAGKELTTPNMRRAAARKAMRDHDISQRRACRLVGVDPKTVRRDKPPDNPEVRKEMNAIANKCRRCHLALKSENAVVSKDFSTLR